ncbi:MAG: hypothetical protein FJ056_07870 [Cyanobacteria bacterium M_surface_10_m2_179]|nr:hypothetical protein [Cyanobacteria bacterium M_surface_10_m2_179]
MTQALTGAALAAVIAACWLLGRPRPKILRSTDASAVAALNRSRMEQVIQAIERQNASAEDAEPVGAAAILPVAGDLRGRRQLLGQLEQQFQAGGQRRREALEVCLAWRHRDALPLIRRGLRDSDCRVAALAAEAMQQFRGRPAPVQAVAAPAPRNVSRTR